MKTKEFSVTNYGQPVRDYKVLGECVAMVDARSLLDNLENARLAMSVALEHTQKNRNQFVKNGTREQARQAERSISKVRGLAEQLQKKFTILQDLNNNAPTSPP